MVKSLYLSNLLLRIGLAAVFLWFGIDKFFHPGYWVDAWVPKWFVDYAFRMGLDSANLIFLFGIFEVVTGVAILSGVFIRIFSLLGAIFLVSVLIFIGFNEVTVRDIGLLGGLLALFFWPSKNGHIY